MRFIIDRMLMELTKWNKIRKIEQHMNQNIQATLMIFLKSVKNFYEKLYTKETTSKTANAEIFSKISNRKISQINKFTIIRISR